MSEDSRGWQPIECAPKDGRLIRLRSAEYPNAGLFYWSKRRGKWVTKVFTVASGLRDAVWADGEPEEWRGAPPPSEEGVER